MTVAKNHDVYDRDETRSRVWPVDAFVAWLTTMLGYIARFKRARRFAPIGRDNWNGLRESEWHRDQLIAQGVAQLCACEPLQLDDTKIQLTPTAIYGGPCPRPPFDMNRRFIALARWVADPEAIIRARFKRLSRSLLAAPGPPRLHALPGTLQSPRKRKLPGSPPLARHPQPAYPQSHVHARRHPSTSRQGHSTPCAGASLTMTGRRRKRRRPSSRPTLR